MPMELSREQMMAVNIGIVPTNELWTPVPLPEGPQEIPSWCKGLRVDWMWGYSNRPTIDILTDGTEYAGEWLFEYETLGTRLYTAEKDGMLRWHSHGMYAWRPLRKGDESSMAWATAQEQGYGGSDFVIRMKTGEEVHLRGPWHVSAPNGFVEVNNYNTSKVTPARLAWELKNRQRWMCEIINPLRTKVMNGEGEPWAVKDNINKLKAWEQRLASPPIWDAAGGTFGMALRNELMIRLFARFQPHLRLAIVQQYGRSYLEPRFAGQAPKEMKIEGQDISGD